MQANSRQIRAIVNRVLAHHNIKPRQTYSDRSRAVGKSNDLLISYVLLDYYHNMSTARQHSILIDLNQQLMLAGYSNEIAFTGRLYLRTRAPAA